MPQRPIARLPLLAALAFALALSAVAAPARAAKPSLKPNDLESPHRLERHRRRDHSHRRHQVGARGLALHGLRAGGGLRRGRRHPRRRSSRTATTRSPRARPRRRPRRWPQLIGSWWSTGRVPRRHSTPSLATSLAEVRDGKAKTNGVAFGRAVAEHLIAVRSTDGRGAAVSFTEPPAPGSLAPDPAGQRPVPGAVVRWRHPADGAQRCPVRPGSAAEPHLRGVHAGLHRGEGVRSADRIVAQPGPDGDRALLLRRPGPAVQLRAARPGHRARTRPRGDRAAAGRRQHERRRRAHRGLVREAEVPLLAAGHGDPPR